MSDITNNEENAAVVETTVDAPETTEVNATPVDADEVVAETPEETTVETPAPAEATPEVVVAAEVVETSAVAAPVVEAAERKGPVIKAPVVKATKTDVVAEDGSRTNHRKVREGIVVSNKMDMTLVVAVNERVRHPRYGKTVQRTKKLYVHDENNDAKIGDRVRVQETRPLSKLKRWRLTEVVERAR
jgi:small subunit ribosomal protein S17